MMTSRLGLSLVGTKNRENSGSYSIVNFNMIDADMAVLKLARVVMIC